MPNSSDQLKSAMPSTLDVEATKFYLEVGFQIQSINTALSSVEKRVKEVEGLITKVNIDLAVLKTKSSMYGALGGLLSAIAVAVASYVKG